MIMTANLSAIFYLVSGVLFILALRGLSSPETSRQGNLFGIIGMIIAISVTFISAGDLSSGFIFVIIFMLAGGSIGAFIAYRIPMTAMPELVAGFHSLVGLAAVFVAIGYMPDFTFLPSTKIAFLRSVIRSSGSSLKEPMHFIGFFSA